MRRFHVLVLSLLLPPSALAGCGASPDQTGEQVGSQRSALCPVTNPECHPPPPPPPKPQPVPPTPTAGATGQFDLIYYRYALEQAGNMLIQKYNTSGHPGSLSWNGPSPMNCGHSCLDAPEAPWSPPASGS